MRSPIFQLILVGLFINFAIAIVSLAVVDVNGNPVFTARDMSRLPNYDASKTNVLEAQGQGLVNPAGVTEDKGNLVFRLLDLIGLGFISKYITILDNLLYGTINVFNALFGQWMSPGLYSFLFGINVFVSPTLYVPIGGALKTIYTVGYIFGAFELWSGRRVVD